MKLILLIVLSILVGLIIGLPVAGMIWFLGGDFCYLDCARIIAGIVLVLSLFEDFANHMNGY